MKYILAFTQLCIYVCSACNITQHFCQTPKQFRRVSEITLIDNLENAKDILLQQICYIEDRIHRFYSCITRFDNIQNDNYQRSNSIPNNSNRFYSTS